jgi:hypothetical protein
MSSIRRVYFYLVTLITLGILAAGVRGLLFLLFDITLNGPSSIGRQSFIQQQLSLGLAMLVIGGPLWYFYWRAVQRNVGTNDKEIGAPMRGLFISLILTVTAIVALFAGSNCLKWVMSGFSSSQDAAGSLATFLVSALIWFYYFRISEGEGLHSTASRTLRRWYIYIVSGWGLVWLTAGVVQLVDAGFLVLPIWGQSLISRTFWSDTVRNNVSWIIIGGVWWAFHWFRLSIRDIGSTLRQVYVYLLAIVGSSITGLVALVITLYETFVWALAPGAASAGYFEFLGWTVPTIVVAAAVWTYHQFLSQEEASELHESLLSARRIHLYIMSFIGLGTLVSGLIMLLGILVDLLINNLSFSVSIQPGWWQKQLSLTVAFLLVATPLWLYYWGKVMGLSTAGGLVEWKARSRRIYLYVIIGAAIIALAADLVNIVYQLLTGVLAGSFVVNLLRNSKWSIQSLIVAAPLLWYHWQIAREDQGKGAEKAASHKLVSIIAGNQSRELISSLEARLGNNMRVLRLSGTEGESPVLSDEEIGNIVAEIESSASNSIMLVVHGGRVLVLPYDETV